MTWKEQRIARIGETKIMHSGLKATIVQYRRANDIDVQFEDGAIREHCGYKEFRDGYISHPDNTRNANKIRRVGQRQLMKNGLTATLIKYRSSASVDVQFDDGVVVKNKTYDQFIGGQIGHPDCLHAMKKKDRTGETRVMNNGMKATIITYRLSDDLDIQFEDGVIREHCAYKEFCEGYIKHPDDTPEGQTTKRIGEKRYMNCGLEATIVEYNSSHDITIQFSDGNVATNKDYSCFLNGTIAHPRLKLSSKSLQETAVGFYLLKFGFIKTSKGDLQHLGFGQMELDFYHPDKKIAVEVDGEVHKLRNQYARDIRKNKVCKDNGIKLYRLREKSLPIIKNSTSFDYVLNGNQLLVGLIDCKKEIDIILTESGFNVSSGAVDYIRDFELIMNMHAKCYFNQYANKRVGEKVFHKTTNQYMTIIDYIGYCNITVQFDDGAVVKNRNYCAFKRGEIKHPSHCSKSHKEQRLGEIRTMNCGLVAKIVKYNNSESISVEFENGCIVNNITYYNWTKGSVKPH